MVDAGVGQAAAQVSQNDLVKVDRIALPMWIEKRSSHSNQKAGLAIREFDLDYFLNVVNCVHHLHWPDQPLVGAHDRVHAADQLRATLRKHHQVVAGWRAGRR